MRTPSVVAVAAVLILSPIVASAAWSPAPTPTTALLRDVEFYDENLGFAVGTGHTILRTTDGGATWALRMGGLFGFGWYDVAWATPNIAVAVGANAVFQPFVAWTIDGGTTWGTQYFYINNNEGTLWGVTASGPLLVAAATLWDGTGVILTNQLLGPSLGAPWTPVLLADAPLVAVEADGTRIVASGADGTVYVSETAGATWIERSPPTNELLWDVSIAGTDLLAVGTNGVAFHSSDAGLSWTQAATGTTTQLRGAALASDGRAVAVGDAGTLLASTDAGATWESVATETSAHLHGADASGLLGTGAWAVGAGGTILVED